MCRSLINDTSSIPSFSLNYDEPDDMRNEHPPAKQLNQKNVFSTNSNITVIPDREKACSLFTNGDGDAPGPDTPGMRPLVPRLKRVQEDCNNFKDTSDLSLPPIKRPKLLEVPSVPKKNYDEDSETVSKFEWLHPSRIKDAKGRRPGDPLYDKRTLHVPPDALRKMSASQKQYWDIKSQYMDILLFFKVVSL